MIWQIWAASLAGLVALAAGLWFWAQRRARARDAAADAAFAAEGQVLRVDGRRVHVLVSGAGPDLILIHGASGNARDVTLALADRLAARYRVIAFDRPGLGWSDPLPNPDLKAQALHLAAAAAQLGVQNPIVVGQSYGGSVALAWALWAPQPPAALLLIAAPSLPWPSGLDLWYRLNDTALGGAVLPLLVAAFVPGRFVARVIEAIFAPDPVPPGYAGAIGVPLSLRRDSLRVNARQVNRLRGQIVAMEPLYPRLTLPMELLHGSADPVVPLDIHSAPLAQRLPHARLTVIEGAGHMPHHSHPGPVVAAIDRLAEQARLHPAGQLP